MPYVSPTLRKLILVWLLRRIRQKRGADYAVIGGWGPCRYWERRKRLLLMYFMWRRQQRRAAAIRESRRRWHIRPTYQTREEGGAWHSLMQIMQNRDRELFFNFVRMTPAQFTDLLNLVTPYLQKHSIRKSISPGERLALTLRYLASPNMMMDMSYSFRISPASVSNIIRETCRALWLVLKDRVFEPLTTELWERTAAEFERKWNFPHCVGAIDGKHCTVQKFANVGSEFYNYKGAHSLVLLAVVDANYKFLVVDIGAKGRRGDAGVLRQSSFGQKLFAGDLGLPQPRIVQGSNRQLPFVFVGDEAFPLRGDMMRPYPGQFRPDSEVIFNYRLSRARRIVENAFGILAARWRVLRGPIVASEITAKVIIQAVVCLHNYLMRADEQARPGDRLYNPPRWADVSLQSGSVVRGQWRNAPNSSDALQRIPQMGSNYAAASAIHIRDQFADYFMDEGQVHWQWKKLSGRPVIEEGEDEEEEEEESS